MTRLSGAGGAAYAVHVIFRYVWQFEVDDMRQSLDVEAPSCDVGCHQDPDIAGLEFVQGPHACCLGFIAVNRGRLEAIRLELGGEPVGSVFGTREYQHLLPVLRTNGVRQQFPLAPAIDVVHDLVNTLGRFPVCGNAYLRRGIQEVCRQEANFFREGGGEQQVLTTTGQDSQDLANIANEAHIEHPIGFIEDEALDSGKIDSPLPQVIQKSSGRCDNDVDTLTQPRNLRVDADTAINDGGAEWQVLPVTAHAVGDLGCQFPGGCEYQSTNPPPIDGTLLETLQHGQCECCRLAGARLGACEDVATGENQGYCLLLDRGRRLVSLFVDRTKQFGRKAKLIE
jgi:hypothetical protein